MIVIALLQSKATLNNQTSSIRLDRPESGGVTPKILRPYWSKRSHTPRPTSPKTTPVTQTRPPIPGPEGGMGGARDLSVNLVLEHGQLNNV